MKIQTRFFALILALLFLLPINLISCSRLPEEPVEEEKEEIKTEATKTEKPEDTVEDPAEDGELCVLMIGNSFCTNFPDEILGLAKEHNIPMRLYTVYYSGCRLQWHWEWYYTKEKKYTLYSCSTDLPSRSSENNVNLDYCFSKANWDFISLQQHFDPSVGEFYDASMETCTPYAELLTQLLQKKFPKAKLLWQQTWGYEVGYQGPAGSDPASIEENKKVLTEEKQTACYESVRNVSLKLCETLPLTRIPSGDAWQIARQNAKIGDTLCQSVNKNDKYHDGDIGGGQYLNACTWFEILTEKSCIGNSYRPEYGISEDKISVLQEAAHRAVEESKGN